MTMIDMHMNSSYIKSHYLLIRRQLEAPIISSRPRPLQLNAGPLRASLGNCGHSRGPLRAASTRGIAGPSDTAGRGVAYPPYPPPPLLTALA